MGPDTGAKSERYSKNLCYRILISSMNCFVMWAVVKIVYADLFTLLAARASNWGHEANPFGASLWYVLYNRAPTESSQYRNLKGGSAVGQPKKGSVDEWTSQSV